MFLLIGVSEPFDYSTRVQREVPKSKLKKYLMFPFFTGTLNAFVWCFIMQIFITVLASAGSTKLGSHADEFFLFIFSAFLSVGFYALLASFIRRRFFSNIATSSTWMIGVIVNYPWYFLSNCFFGIPSSLWVSYIWIFESFLRFQQRNGSYNEFPRNVFYNDVFAPKSFFGSVFKLYACK